MIAAATPLRGKYLVRNRLLYNLLRSVDAILASRRTDVPVKAPRRLLLANLAHLGDVLHATGVLPALHRAFPGIEIGFLAGSWSRPVLDGHPRLCRVHWFDHAWLNRSEAGRTTRLLRHLRTRREALAGIRAAGYDVAIDLYPHFPNAGPLLHAAGVPVRIGHTSGGFGPLLTHPHDWSLSDRHVTDYHVDLLRALPLPEAIDGPLPADLPAMHTPVPSDSPGGYIQLHPGSGNAIKDWPEASWRELAETLAMRGHPLVFTGNGAREQHLCGRLSAALPACRDYSGRLSWPQFVAVVRGARVLIGVDSIAGHLAAALGTPCVVVSTGITGPTLWRPVGPSVRVLRHPVGCMPCWRSRGCTDMACVRQVSVAEVAAAIDWSLRRQPPVEVA